MLLKCLRRKFRLGSNLAHKRGAASFFYLATISGAEKKKLRVHIEGLSQFNNQNRGCPPWDPHNFAWGQIPYSLATEGEMHCVVVAGTRRPQEVCFSSAPQKQHEKKSSPKLLQGNSSFHLLARQSIMQTKPPPPSPPLQSQEIV